MLESKQIEKATLDTRGFIKLIKNPESDLLLGARIVAPDGSELTMEIGLEIPLLNRG